MKTSTPLVSVVMPVYNGGSYLIDAVASVIEQSCTDWELICVNDGSTDGSQAVLEWFAGQDRRIRVLHQQNAGIVSALNLGCFAARAPLIARMDCDDIATPDRLCIQTRHMREQPQCVVVGGAILEMDAAGHPLRLSRLATRHEQIVENLLCRRTGHFHPTTLIRAAAFEAVGGYRTEYQWIEDHDLWLRLSSRGQLANLTDVVLRYRQHTGSVCWQRAAQQRQLMNQLLRQAHQQRGLDVPDSVLAHPAQSRSAAGPGKWARAAAKGGFPVSVHKHLRELFKSHAATRYKFRMFAESVARLMVSFPLRLLRESAALPSGNYDAWHTKWRQHQGRERAA